MFIPPDELVWLEAGAWHSICVPHLDAGTQAREPCPTVLLVREQRAGWSAAAGSALLLHGAPADLILSTKFCWKVGSCKS